MIRTTRARLWAFMLVVILVSCGPATGSTPANNTGSNSATTIILGAYTTPREAYGKLIPLFKERWKQEHNQELTFQESYLGSGAQSRAIVGGFEADIAALSLEADMNRIAAAGLITHDWKNTPTRGMVSDSIVVFAVRKGNPKAINDWADLARPGLDILTPNPATSGGAMWNITALYGAAKRGFVDGVPKDDDAAAAEFLKAVLRNVKVMDKGARESMTTFEKGVGDVAITYENEVRVGQKGGQDYEMVTPRSTILIENPIALVDTYVDKHGNRAVVEAFMAFLLSAEAQNVFADYGLRSVDSNVAKAHADAYKPVEDQWTIDYLSGWKEVTPKLFGDNGVYTQAIAEIQQ